MIFEGKLEDHSFRLVRAPIVGHIKHDAYLFCAACSTPVSCTSSTVRLSSFFCCLFALFQGLFFSQVATHCVGVNHVQKLEMYKSTEHERERMLQAIRNFRASEGEGLLFFQNTADDVMLARLELAEACFASGVPMNVSLFS